MRISRRQFPAFIDHRHVDYIIRLTTKFKTINRILGQLDLEQKLKYPVIVSLTLAAVYYINRPVNL